MRRRLRQVLTWLVLTVVSGATACGAGQTRHDESCMRHDQCRSGEACVLGGCVPGALTEPFDPSEFRASQWFETDGSCATDDACGPWACSAGTCVDPASAWRELPARGELSYWDGSCALESDCGPWTCANGWCHSPDHVDPTSSVRAAANAGASCLGDSGCPSGSDCAAPGYCREDVTGEPLTFGDLASEVPVPGGWCASDLDCGPWVCSESVCVAPDAAGANVPLRGDIEFWDASCSEDSHCGPWTCRDGWCRDPGL